MGKGQSPRLGQRGRKEIFKLGKTVGVFCSQCEKRG